ncbi:MAG TPA: hypothetical protein VLA30_01410 [Burkholderiales bacterium]|nr:hypothetical protein [Burkholderiales bacterium]
MTAGKISALIAVLALVGIVRANAFPLVPPMPQEHVVTITPGQNKLLCFGGTTESSGYGGRCTPNPMDAKDSVTLDTTDGHVDGSHAGIYTNDSTMYGRKLGDVSRLSFRYTGSSPTANSPRFSLPIDKDGDGAFDQWAFIHALDCNDGAGSVDAIINQKCPIKLEGAATYDNWAALVAAFPNARIARNQYVLGLVFIVADEPGIWTVDRVKFGYPAK